MKRRRFLTTLLAGGLTGALTSEAQQTGKVWRIGYLTPAQIPRAPLLEALRDLGYVEGQAIRLDVRSAENHLARLLELAVAPVQAKVDLIVALTRRAGRSP